MDVAGTELGICAVVVAGGTDDDGAMDGAVLDGAPDVLGPVPTKPIRAVPPPGQLSTARVTAAAAAAVAATRSGHRRRSPCTGAGTV
jgi:hypothetical protein